ncbi:type VII secretion-associated serine protease mycosin [Streptomyces sp. N2-109]|uniref:Type VII secretion-associated serine protease mycosin n=1 Tax=Streptomyces gossypii TaxID=2883101 RepID=A0ABT2JTP3_9ACTN|nr:type VII secretion-associated serine protease mycosin [Streptomyces gossypii]MCT2591063.1 type VII secretion-associated serine protease mycosin [Streptomyces gossypii]
MRRKVVGRTPFSKLVLGALSVALVGVAAVPAQAEDARSRQWHLDAMQAEKMWKVSKGEGVTVAVIDSGVDSSVTDLQGQVLKGKDISGRPGDAHDDYSNHGTGMAALIAATGNAGAERGTYGLAPASKILPLRVADSYRSKNQAEAESVFGKQVGSAIRYAADSKAKIINISLASLGETRELKAAVEYALSKGKLIFAGVGNEGNAGNHVMYPAATPGVVGVAEVDEKANGTDESQHGPQVDLAAPGDDMVSACSGGVEVCTSSGTSNATAIASASAALIWAEHPDWTANQVIRVLVNTAGGPKSGKERTDYVGYGAVRPRIALKDPGDPGDPDTNPLPGPYSEKNASPSPSKNAGDKDQQDSKGEDQEKAAPASASDDGTSTTTWALYGLAAAGVLAAAIAIPLTRSRRRTAAAQATTAPPGPYLSQPSAPPWPNTPLPPAPWDLPQPPPNPGDHPNH